MKKIIIFIFLAVFFALQACSETVLEGKITYTVESARKLAFDGIPRTIPHEQIDSYMQDRDRKDNIDALKNGADLENRSVQLFKGMIFKAYAVTYYDNPKYTYYYLNAMNQLAFIDIDEVDATKLDEIKYPFRTIRYDLRGNLMAVGIYVSDEERFLYKKDGTLIAHWIGNVGYNAKGRKIGTIEQIKF